MLRSRAGQGKLNLYEITRLSLYWYERINVASRREPDPWPERGEAAAPLRITRVFYEDDFGNVIVSGCAN